MPPSERVREHILEWAENRKEDPDLELEFLFLQDDESNENNNRKNYISFTDLKSEEFDGVESMPEWNQVKVLSFISLDKLTKLPILPIHLEFLTIEKNSVLHFVPILPRTLKEITIIENPRIVLPPYFPNRLVVAFLKDNDLKELPIITTVPYYGLFIEEKNLEPPFREIYEAYINEIDQGEREKTAEQLAAATKRLYRNIREAWKERMDTLKLRGQNVKSARLAFGKSRLPENVLGVIGSYLSNKKGPLKNQGKTLKEEHNKIKRGGGTRRLRRV